MHTGFKHISACSFFAYAYFCLHILVYISLLCKYFIYQTCMFVHILAYLGLHIILAYFCIKLHISDSIFMYGSFICWFKYDWLFYIIVHILHCIFCIIFHTCHLGTLYSKHCFVIKKTLWKLWGAYSLIRPRQAMSFDPQPMPPNGAGK